MWLFPCVSCPFFMRWMHYVSGIICFVRSYPLASFGHVQNFERMPPDKNVRWMNVSRALVCSLSGSRAVCEVLMRSASWRYPICICSTKFPGRVPHAHSVFEKRTFCTFLIRYIFVLSVIHPLHVRKMTVLCPLLVRYVCALYDFRDDLHSHRDDFHHRINMFCPFSVRLASVTFIS